MDTLEQWFTESKRLQQICRSELNTSKQKLTSKVYTRTISNKYTRTPEVYTMWQGGTLSGVVCIMSHQGGAALKCVRTYSLASYHFVIPKCISSHYITANLILPFSKLRTTLLHIAMLHCCTVHNCTLQAAHYIYTHFITAYYITSNYISAHYIPAHYIAAHYIARQVSDAHLIAANYNS